MLPQSVLEPLNHATERAYRAPPEAPWQKVGLRGEEAQEGGQGAEGQGGHGQEAQGSQGQALQQATVFGEGNKSNLTWRYIINLILCDPFGAIFSLRP